MSQKLLLKMAYYSIYLNQVTKKYVIDSGKTIKLKGLNKIVVNTNREVKEFDELEDAKSYITKKLDKSKKRKVKILKKLPKSLYLILMKEEGTGNTFVKVGITSKKYISRRFSKEYGYEGYEIEKILRKVDTPYAEKYEKQIKDALNKKGTINKYLPILEHFSGYSECYNVLSINEIISIFDQIAKITL
jgi:hypothetical protein